MRLYARQNFSFQVVKSWIKNFCHQIQPIKVTLFLISEITDIFVIFSQLQICLVRVISNWNASTGWLFLLFSSLLPQLLFLLDFALHRIKKWQPSKFFLKVLKVKIICKIQKQPLEVFCKKRCSVKKWLCHNFAKFLRTPPGECFWREPYLGPCQTLLKASGWFFDYLQKKHFDIFFCKKSPS